MNISIKFDKKYKEQIKEIEHQIEHGIVDLVHEINKFNWYITINSCGGHRFENRSPQEFPFVEFVINDEDFLYFIVDKIKNYNYQYHTIWLSLHLCGGTVNEWLGVDKDKDVWAIKLTLIPLPHNIGRIGDRLFSNMPESIHNYLADDVILKEIKTRIIMWFEEFKGE